MNNSYKPIKYKNKSVADNNSSSIRMLTYGQLVDSDYSTLNRLRDEQYVIIKSLSGQIAKMFSGSFDPHNLVTNNLQFNNLNHLRNMHKKYADNISRAIAVKRGVEAEMRLDGLDFNSVMELESLIDQKVKMDMLG